MVAEYCQTFNMEVTIAMRIYTVHSGPLGTPISEWSDGNGKWKRLETLLTCVPQYMVLYSYPSGSNVHKYIQAYLTFLIEIFADTSNPFHIYLALSSVNPINLDVLYGPIPVAASPT